MEISIEIITGSDIKEIIDIVSKMRIDAFKEFPYLYRGEMEYEKAYVNSYLIDQDSMIVIAKYKHNVIGICTGIPLSSDSIITSDIKEIFFNNRIPIENYYYNGEIIILPEFRGKHLLGQIYRSYFRAVRDLGYNKICILTVIREPNHILKPHNFTNHDHIWTHYGFNRNNITIEFEWPTIQPDLSSKYISNPMELWVKQL